MIHIKMKIIIHAFPLGNTPSKAREHIPCKELYHKVSCTQLLNFFNIFTENINYS